MPRNRYRPQILVLATFVVVAALLLVWFGVLNRPDEAAAARGPVAIKAALAEKMRVTLERMSPEQHQHGGVGSEPASLVCGTRVYGYAPADAATVDDVGTVYGFHMCGVVEPGRDWNMAQKLVAPLVMKLDTALPTLQIAESSNGVSYRDRVKQLFPVQYQKSAFEQGLEPDQLAEVQRRFEAAVDAASAASCPPRRAPALAPRPGQDRQFRPPIGRPPHTLRA